MSTGTLVIKFHFFSRQLVESGISCSLYFQNKEVEFKIIEIMKKLFIILAVVFGTQSYASAQWFGGYISPNVMCDPCVQASIAAANSAAWVSSIDMALMAQQMQMMAACPGGYVPSYNTSGWDSCSTTTSSTPVYESRYGDIDCHLCHGTGVCQTCN